MIRLIQRRLIVPRGDTGTFSIPVLAGKNTGDASVFTIFDPLTHRKICEKVMQLSDGVLSMQFTHGDTVNLPVGQYVWDIKFYSDPVIADGHIVGGEEVDSYYAAFTLPVCEIRETGDNLLMDDRTPNAMLAPDQIDLITASLAEIAQARAAAASSAAEADTSATNAETSASAAAVSAQAALDSQVAALASQQAAQAAATDAANSAATATQKAAQIEADLANKADKSEIPTLVSQLENDSGYLIQESDPTVPAWAKAQTKPTYTAQEVGALPSDTVIPTIPTNVSAFTNDVGYLTEHQDISGKANVTDLELLINNIAPQYEDLTFPISDRQFCFYNNNLYESIYAINDQEEWNPSHWRQEDLSTFVTTLYKLINLYGGMTVQKYTKPATGIPKTDLAEAVQHSLNQADNAYQKPSTGIPASDLEETYLTSYTETDPTVPSWAKAAEKPTYTAAEVGAPTVAEMQQAIANINSMNIHICTQGEYNSETGVPTIQNPDTSTFYLVPGGEGSNLFIEWAYVNNAWERFGSADVDLSNYVQKTDYAHGNTAGVVKVSPATYGISTTSDGYLTFVPSGHNKIKAGDDNIRVSTVSMQHEATFYGLAKAAGDTTQSQSNNAVGTYTTEAKTAIQTMLDVPSKSEVQNLISVSTTAPQGEDAKIWIDTDDSTTVQVPTVAEMNAALAGKANVADIPTVPVQDVQVNGTSILQDGVANVPIASSSVPGVTTVNGKGVTVENGELKVVAASHAQIKAGAQAFNPITPTTQKTSVFYALASLAGASMSQSSNAVGVYTDEAKGAIQKMLGISNLIAPEENDFVADRAYSIGDIFTANGKLYKATVAIAAEGNIIPSTNCTETTINEIFLKKSEQILIPGTGEGSVRTIDITINGKTYSSIASGKRSISMGIGTQASGSFSFAIGENTVASGYGSYAEGLLCTASNAGAHAEGQVTKSQGNGTHAEGIQTTAIATGSHTEGIMTTASGAGGHAEGDSTTAAGYASHSAGLSSTAAGMVSHAGGYFTIASGRATYVFGQFNIDLNAGTAVSNQGTYVEIIGNGSADNARSNAYALTWTGTGRYAGDVYVGCNNDSTGGTRLATITEVAAKLDAAEAGLKVVRLI